jgi:hypothetical protein
MAISWVPKESVCTWFRFFPYYRCDRQLLRELREL